LGASAAGAGAGAGEFGERVNNQIEGMLFLKIHAVHVSEHILDTKL
jgi:hypothetical protein